MDDSAYKMDTECMLFLYRFHFKLLNFLVILKYYSPSEEWRDTAHTGFSYSSYLKY